MKIISAPFGNYLRFKGWISTIGTFTPQFRGGFAYRMWRCARTLRWDSKRGGWVNRLGLPNPGIDWLGERPWRAQDRIVSIGIASNDGVKEFIHLLAVCQQLKPLYFELNVSCPNEDRGLQPEYMIELAAGAVDPNRLVVKMPPDREACRTLVDLAVRVGVRRFHFCNTTPTERGGLSGHSLVPLVAPIILDTKERWPQVEIIAGGGITGQPIADLYRVMGADHFAIGSGWLSPMSWLRLRRISW